MGVAVPLLRQVYDDSFRLAWYTTFIVFVTSCLYVLREPLTRQSGTTLDGVV